MDVIKDLKETVKEAPKEAAKTLQKLPFKLFEFPNLSNLTHKTAKKVGKTPGSIIYVGKERKEPIKIQVIDYTKTRVNEFEAKNVEEVFKYRDRRSITWINVTGIHDTDVIQKIGDHFKLSPLLLEDVANTNQRPKIEDFGNHIFLVLKMIYYDEEKNQVKTEQVSLVLGKGFVISFQEREGDVFNSIRERIRVSRIKLLDSDYLTYTLVDLIVDNYFLVLDNFGDQISQIEENLMKDPDPRTLNTIYGLKRELILIRKFINPLREVLNSLQKIDSRIILKETKRYIQDVYDHEVQIIDTIDSYRDMLSGLQDLYISITSNKMNEVMKVLTIIATIFIPLTFLAGIYGMNFEYMPELAIKWFYPFIWGVMVLIAAGMIIYFKKKNWL